MAIDGKERIFVADKLNHRIQCFDHEGNFLFKFDTLKMERRDLHSPTDIAFDCMNKRLLVTDTYYRSIQVFDLEGKYIFSIGHRQNRNWQVGESYGIAVDQEGNICMSDAARNHILILDSKGTLLRKFGSQGGGEGELRRPWGIGILSNGDLVLAEAWSYFDNKGNQRLSVFTSKGQFLRFIGEGQVTNPLWIFVDSQDNILVTDNDKEGVPCLLWFSREGKLLRRIGKGAFHRTYGVVMNRKGDIFVSGIREDDQHCIFNL